jgi:hypothetical protein
VRMILRTTVCFVLLLGLAAAHGRPAAAQGDEDLLPEQSAAKAKAILQQVISALGGRAFLNARDSDCTGRLAQYGHNGQVMGNTLFREMWLLPDKNRREYISKGQHNIAGYLLGADRLSIAQGGVLITVFDGERGWVLDKSGVSSQPETAIKSFVEQVKSGMNNMLRSRMNEDGVEFRYAGSDLVDMKEAEWIEIYDRDHRVFRMAVEKSTHLPLRWVVTTRDPETRAQTEIVTSYTQFISIGGIETPLSVSRAQNGRQVSQIFFTGCKYNANLSPQLFTPASLEKRSSAATKKGYENGENPK